MASRQGIDAVAFGAEAERLIEEMRATRARYGGGGTAASAAGRLVIVVDDGLSTGGAMSAALRILRCEQPARLICAVPVAALEALAEVDSLADETFCLATPTPFRILSRYYLDFSGVGEDQIAATLREARSAPVDARQRAA
jgi:putative phosphoribosyl transferase